MEFIKNIAISFGIVFSFIIFITNDTIRKGTIDVLNHNIGKSKIKIYNIFILLISIIIICLSIRFFYKIKILESLFQRKLEQ